MFWKGSTATVACVEDPEEEDAGWFLICQSAIPMTARSNKAPIAQSIFELKGFDSTGVVVLVFWADVLIGRAVEAEELATGMGSSSTPTNAARPDSVSLRSLINS